MFKKTLIVSFVLIFVFVTALMADVNDQPQVLTRPEWQALHKPAATYTVTNTNNAGAGSLRQAIIDANTNAGNDLIDFNIPGAGPHTIFPLSQLPPLTDTFGVTINGLTEPGASAGANPPATAILMIVIDGTNAGAAHGLWSVSPNNSILGLVINNFEQDGIRIQGMPYPTRNNFVGYNFIGTNQTGTVAQGNGLPQARLWAGVYIIVTPDTIGFAYDNYVQCNLISANYAEGAGIASCPPGDVAYNDVSYNYIGTDITGTVDLGNAHDGVYIGEGAHHNTVGWNFISGNDFEGVCIVGYAEIGIYTNSNTVMSNTIGLTTASMPLPNTRDGVSIGQYGTWYYGGYAQDNSIHFNTIAHNGRHGVMVWEHWNNTTNADYNPITQNGMYHNGALGIDLADDGVTANDPGDPDTGPNEEMNFPVIDSAIYSGGTTTIYGTLATPSPNTATVEVFQARLDPTGYGEGERYLGSTTPDALGNWSLVNATLVVGDSVTATATDQNNNTSEFCLCVIVRTSGILCGDVDGSGPPVVNVADLTYLVNYLFRGGPLPVPSACVADVDGSGPPVVNVADLTYLVSYLFRGGPPPVAGCCSPSW